MRSASRFSIFSLVAALALVATSANAQVIGLVINELDCDTPTLPANDDKEFIELWEPTGSQSLVGYTLVFYSAGNSSNPCSTGVSSYFAMNLTGTTDAGGYYLVGTPVVVPTPSQTWPVTANGTLQNGADAVALYFGTSAAAFPNGTAVTATNLVDAVCYDTDEFPACNLIAVLTPGQPSVNENTNNNSQINSIGRCPNGQGGAFITVGWQAISPTPGAFNSTCATNVYSISITQPGGCANPININVINAAPNAELYNIFSLVCSTPAGSGPLFGLEVGFGSGDPLQQFFYPLGSLPFHVNADGLGAWGLSIPVFNCPGFTLPIEAVSIQVTGFTVIAVTQTTLCVNVTI